MRASALSGRTITVHQLFKKTQNTDCARAQGGPGAPCRAPAPGGARVFKNTDPPTGPNGLSHPEVSILRSQTKETVMSLTLRPTLWRPLQNLSGRAWYQFSEFDLEREREREREETPFVHSARAETHSEFQSNCQYGDVLRRTFFVCVCYIISSPFHVLTWARSRGVRVREERGGIV